MRRILILFLGIYVGGLIAGCGSLKKIDTALFKNSTLSNLNPAPKSLAPPEVAPEDTLVDPVYLRSQADYHYTLGEALSLEGNKSAAVEEFKMTLIYDSTSPDVRTRLAEEYVRLGLLSEAIEQAEAAVQLDPSNISGHMLLGRLYSSLKMYNQALAQYKTVIELDGDNSKAQVLIGAVLAEQRKFDEAEKYFDEVAKNPKNENPHSAHYYKAKIREERGPDFYDRAEESYVKAITLKPSEERTTIALGELYLKMDKEEKAIKLVRSFQDKFGSSSSSAQFLSRLHLEREEYDKAYFQLEQLEGFERDNLNIKVKMALILIEKKHYTLAVDKLEEILTLAPDSDKIRFYLGAVYEELGKPFQAIEQFQKIPSASNYYTEAVIHAAFQYKSQSKFEDAKTVIEGAIKERDNIPEFYAFYASLLDEMQEYKVAVSMLDTAVRKFPSHTQLRFFLGSMHDRLGNKNETIKAMKEVVSLDEEHVQALNFLAYTYAELSTNLDEAEELARKALKLSPNDGYILDTIGWVLFKQGRTKESIQYLEAAFKTKKEESVVAEHLGDAYYRYELVDKAKLMYIHAVRLEKDLDKKARLREKIVAITNQINNKARTPASTKRQSKAD